MNGLKGTMSGSWERNLEVVMKIQGRGHGSLNQSSGGGDGRKQISVKNT